MRKTKVVEYTIVSGLLQDVVSKVNELIGRGWQPVGPHSAGHHPNLFSQTMVRYGKPYVQPPAPATSWEKAVTPSPDLPLPIVHQGFEFTHRRLEAGKAEDPGPSKPRPWSPGRSVEPPLKTLEELEKTTPKDPVTAFFLEAAKKHARRVAEQVEKLALGVPTPCTYGGGKVHSEDCPKDCKCRGPKARVTLTDEQGRRFLEIACDEDDPDEPTVLGG